MIDVKSAEIAPNKLRIGFVIVTYYDLRLRCEICLYKDIRLWIRMPEIWLNDSVKKQYVFWDDNEKSDEFQKIILSKVFDLLGLSVEKAVAIKKEHNEKRKLWSKTEK